MTYHLKSKNVLQYNVKWWKQSLEDLFKDVKKKPKITPQICEKLVSKSKKILNLEYH